MLRKRARSIHKDQEMGQITSDDGSESYLQSDFSDQRQKTSSFFNVPGLFVGLSPKSVLDCDSVRSPTSPLDFKFSNLGTSLRFPKPSHQKCWNCNKIGLGSIVDSLDDVGDRNLSLKPIPSSNSKTILFGLQVRGKNPNSLPNNYAIFPNAKTRQSNLRKGSSDVLFEIGGNPLESESFGMIHSFSLDSKRIGSEMFKLRAHNADLRTANSRLRNGTTQGSSAFCAESGLASGQMSINPSQGVVQSLTPSEIELSEDYTRVISHGPIPKTTHIFGDCVLESHLHVIDSGNKSEISETRIASFEMPLPVPYPSTDFLSCCDFCKKKLEDGKDIYIYRGEKAFCSWDCRLEEISIEEEKEKSISEVAGGSPKFNNDHDNFEKSLFVGGI